MEEILLNEIAESIGNDNKSVEELIDNIMQRVEWTRADEKRWKKLTPEQQDSFRQPDYMLRRIAEIRYAKDNLRDIVYENLKRAQGNLGDKDKMMGLYDTLEKFNYSCPYSDTLLIGGEQPIHIDHIIPVAMGGPTDDWNCIPVCGRCNMSKHDKHLLDWWQYNRTAEEEYKLVRIFEHMTSKLLNNSNQIRYVPTEDNTKHLDVITFLKQLLDHIEQNKQYILGPNSSILDDNSKAIESKLKELKKTFESVVKKNSNKTLKTDKQYFKEQKQMVKYLKDLGIYEHYYLAYTYFEELNKMILEHANDNEIIKYCRNIVGGFYFEEFYLRLKEFEKDNEHTRVPFEYYCEDGYPLYVYLNNVRLAKRSKQTEYKTDYKKFILTENQEDKLARLQGFKWDIYIISIDELFDIVMQWYEKYNTFEASNNSTSGTSRVTSEYQQYYSARKKLREGFEELSIEKQHYLKERGFLDVAITLDDIRMKNLRENFIAVKRWYGKHGFFDGGGKSRQNGKLTLEFLEYNNKRKALKRDFEYLDADDKKWLIDRGFIPVKSTRIKFTNEERLEIVLKHYRRYKTFAQKDDEDVNQFRAAKQYLLNNKEKLSGDIIKQLESVHFFEQCETNNQKNRKANAINKNFNIIARWYDVNKTFLGNGKSRIKGKLSQEYIDYFHARDFIVKYINEIDNTMYKWLEERGFIEQCVNVLNNSIS